MSEQWYSIVEYARSFHISDMTVRRRIKNGKLHAILRDGKYYIPVHDGQLPGNKLQKDPQLAEVPASVSGHELSVSLPKVIQPGVRERLHEQDFSQKPVFQQKPRPPVQPVPIFSGGTAAVPEQLTNFLEVNENSLVSTAALIAFCESVIAKFNDLENKLEDRHQAKLQNVEASLREKESEVTQLQQQIEDLQLLVKILERKI